MNNITFPEMDSVTSASDTVLNTLDQNLNIFKVQPAAPVQISVPALVQPPPPQPQIPSQVSLPSKPVSRPPLQSQLQSQSQSQSQPQQNRTVSFNNNVQQKVIPAIKRNVTPKNPVPLPAPAVETSIPTTTQIVPQNNSEQIMQKDSENSESKLSALSKFNIGDEILKIGKFSLPKKTLLLLGMLLIIGGVLFYLTKPKENNVDKKKKEDEEENK
jgi:hypothetical protein